MMILVIILVKILVIIKLNEKSVVSMVPYL